MVVQRIGKLAISAWLATAVIGCAQIAQKPDLISGGMNVQGIVMRDDFQVSGDVEGTSSTQSYLLGALKIIDGSKVRLLWIFPLYRETAGTPLPSYISRDSSVFGGLLKGLLVGFTESRAYYDAIEKAPEADLVFEKGFWKEGLYIPLLYSNETVTFRGKTMVIKPDGAATPGGAKRPFLGDSGSRPGG